MFVYAYEQKLFPALREAFFLVDSGEYKQSTFSPWFSECYIFSSLKSAMFNIGLPLSPMV